MEARYIWDPKKAANNLAKHGVSFDDAVEAFGDPGHVVVENDDVDGEQRYLLIGMTRKLVLVVTVFVTFESPHSMNIRIISARKAVAYEKSIYEDQNS